jgi:hypothetical protein
MMSGTGIPSINVANGSIPVNGNNHSVHEAVLKKWIMKASINADHVTERCAICANRSNCFTTFPTTFVPFPCDGFEINYQSILLNKNSKY